MFDIFCLILKKKWDWALPQSFLFGEDFEFFSVKLYIKLFLSQTIWVLQSRYFQCKHFPRLSSWKPVGLLTCWVVCEKMEVSRLLFINPLMAYLFWAQGDVFVLRNGFSYESTLFSVEIYVKTCNKNKPSGGYHWPIIKKLFCYFFFQILTRPELQRSSKHGGVMRFFSGTTVFFHNDRLKLRNL